MSSFDTPRITLQDVAGEGSSFKYYAFYGEQFSPGETGWVLVAEDTDPFIEPQALSSEDVFQDIDKLVSDPDWREGLKLLVVIAAKEMLEAIQSGKVGEPKHPGEMSAKERAKQMQEDLLKIS